MVFFTVLFFYFYEFLGFLPPPPPPSPRVPLPLPPSAARCCRHCAGAATQTPLYERMRYSSRCCLLACSRMQLPGPSSSPFGQEATRKGKSRRCSSCTPGQFGSLLADIILFTHDFCVLPLHCVHSCAFVYAFVCACLSRMVESGCVPNSVTYTALLTMWGSSRHPMATKSINEVSW